MKKHTAIVRKIEGLEDLLLDIPGALFAEMDWNANTKLMWVINDEGNVVIRPPKYDTEPGIPVEFNYFLESNKDNDSSS